MKIGYVTNASPQSGVGKPAREIARRLQDKPEVSLQELSLQAQNKLPKPLNAKPIQWWLQARQLPKEGFDLWHFTNQTMGFINRFPSVITVFDLIELLEPQTKYGRLAARYLFHNIPKANHIICVSEHGRGTIQQVYGIPNERLTVIPLAAGEVFTHDPAIKPSLAYHELLHKLHLTTDQKIVLYVGSEHPRKNLTVLLEAFAQVRKHIPDAILIKVGDPGIASGRATLLADIDRLGIREAVKLFGPADDAALHMLYNIADVFVFPSTFEGFGIPPLEAMACGCPVITSNATSLPEVVDDAGIQCDPQDIDGFANAIERVLTDTQLAQDLRTRSLAQSKKFSWDTSAAATLAVYKKVVM